MSDHLLDTNILIRHFRETEGYDDLMDALSGEGRLYISAITRLEIVRGMRDHEKVSTFHMLDSLQTIPMTARIADLAGELIHSWRAQGVTLSEADAIIAATAIHHELTLVTTNARHFPMPELALLQADDSGRLTRITK